MESNTQRGVKSLWAVIAASAVIVMAVLAVAQDQERTGTVAASGMSVGQTTTEASVPASVVQTPIARPAVKAKRPKGF